MAQQLAEYPVQVVLVDTRGCEQALARNLQPGITHQIGELARDFDVVPVVQELTSDTVTPFTVYSRLAANGRNPIPIIIPCHRVIGSSGDLTGFGGGLDTKEALLRLEAENSGLLK